MLKPSYRGEHRLPRLVCLLLRGAEKCSENGWDKQEKWDKNAQKERTARRTDRKPTSSDCQSLHPFSSDERGASVFIGRRATSYHIRATSTHLEKRGGTGDLCLYICPRLPYVSLAFIGVGNKDFDCVYLHQKEKKQQLKTILI